MKYIKTFEGVMWQSSEPEYHMKKDEFKFKFGDHVRLKWESIPFIPRNLTDRKQIFYITAIKDTFQEKPINAYYLDYNDGEHFGWIKEEDLELIPDYELDAIKYNM